MGKTVIEQAREDLDVLLKLGMEVPKGIPKARLQFFKSLAPSIASALAGVGVSAIGGYYLTKKNREAEKVELTDSLKSLAAKSPQFQKDPLTFTARFNELSMISPTIAKNPSFASKILDKKMTAGFSVDDIHKLTSIEHSTAMSRKLGPGAAARASAADAFHTIVSAFGPDFLQQSRHHKQILDDKISEIHNAQAEAKKLGDELGLTKLESANFGGPMQKVSDECLGTMLAERYIMIKQAGLLGEAVKNMGKGLTIFGPAIALGAGVEGVRQWMESRRNTALHAEADRNYMKLFKKNENWHSEGNKELANEAFATLKAVAPSLAAKPLVAETFINYTVGQGQLAPQTIQQLAEAEDKVRGISGGKGFADAMKGTMSNIKTISGFSSPGEIGKFEEMSRKHTFGGK